MSAERSVRFWTRSECAEASSGEVREGVRERMRR